MNSASASWSRLLLSRPAASFLRDDLRRQIAGQGKPAKPQAWHEALARRAGVDDVLRRKRLERADGLPVIPELAVVVVLDHQSAGLRGPVGDLPTPRRSQRHA